MGRRERDDLTAFVLFWPWGEGERGRVGEEAPLGAGLFCGAPPRWASYPSRGTHFTPVTLILCVSSEQKPKNFLGSSTGAEGSSSLFPPQHPSTSSWDQMVANYPATFLGRWGHLRCVLCCPAELPGGPVSVVHRGALVSSGSFDWLSFPTFLLVHSGVASHLRPLAITSLSAEFHLRVAANQMHGSQSRFGSSGTPENED